MLPFLIILKVISISLTGNISRNFFCNATIVFSTIHVQWLLQSSTFLIHSLSLLRIKCFYLIFLSLIISFKTLLWMNIFNLLHAAISSLYKNFIPYILKQIGKIIKSPTLNERFTVISF